MTDLFTRDSSITDEDPVKQQQAALKAQQQQINLQRHERSSVLLQQLLRQPASRPVQLGSVRVDGTANSKQQFIQHQLAPLLNDPNLTVESLLQALEKVAHNLNSVGIFDQMNFYLDTDNPEGILEPRRFSAEPAVPLNISIDLHHVNRFTARTGTNVGNGEGNGYLNVQIQDVFGGAEKLSVDATLGTKTRNSYLANISTPWRYSADWKTELSAFASSRKVDYSSHDQTLQGVSAKLLGSPVGRVSHQFGLEAVWRCINTHSYDAARAVFAQAGDSFKTSLTHCFMYDSRDNHLLPTKGVFFKATNELAGPGLAATGSYTARNSAHFFKTQTEGTFAYSFGPRADVILSLGVSTGFLWSLNNRPTSLIDRFYLGGPNTVRGFLLNGLGPHEGADALGGNAYFATGLSALSRIPRLSPDSNLRLHGFVNTGALQNVGKGVGINDVARLLRQPSVSAGFGVVFAHPIARFELNFTLPIVAHQTDLCRKGVQFGVGFSFL